MKSTNLKLILKNAERRYFIGLKFAVIHYVK